MSRSVLAIDPGKTGGIALHVDGVWTFKKMPATIQDLRLLLGASMSQGIIAYIEEIPKHAGVMGGSSLFVLAQNYGQCEGILAMLDVPVVHVRPQLWQKALGLGNREKTGSPHRDRTAWKNKLKGRAQDYFPTAGLTLDTCDAALIAYAAVNRLI